MYGTVNRIFLSFLLVFAVAFPAEALAKSAKRLLTINDSVYTSEDFQNWWRHWNDKNEQKFPDTPEQFIDFQIMVQQGREMGYDAKPEYLRKLAVFLQVQTMMALKYEEVDSKAQISEAEVKKYFAENYGTVSTLQILTFDSADKARIAYQHLQPYQGQIGGRLAFADLYGGEAEEKADAYDEVQVTVADFQKNKITGWLPIFDKLQPNQVSEPFLHEAGQKYILLRLVESKPAPEGAYAEKTRFIQQSLNKEKRNHLTSELVERLKKKYKVQVDQDLLASIKLDGDYPQEFLEQKVASMEDLEITVNDLLYNALKEKRLRVSLSDEEIKLMTMGSIISQTLINRESLARGYEKRQPMLPTYEFYKQNRLRIEVETGLADGLAVSDQEILDYYEKNLGEFSVPAKVDYSMLKGPEEVLKKVWVGTLQGVDFKELAEKYSLEVRTQKEALDSLSPLLAEELKKLDKGGISVPLALNGEYILVKVVEHFPGQVTPPAQVKGKISDQLKKEKFAAAKVEYINKLKSRSKIDINARVWKDLTRELANAKKD